ncbi:MAG TPA: hypothetical protein VHZ56_02395 [Devosia sp.]|nr:hypothetical protein [Devosia sp.]
MPAPDPTAGFTDMQWYMYRRRNVAFFAAYTSRAFSADDLLRAARSLVELAPQLATGRPGGITDAMLRALIYRETVASLDGFPERWLDRGDAVLADPALPLFRIRYAAAEAPSPDGRAGFLLVQVSHALVEGADSALLSRSQSAAHPPAVSSPRRTSPLVAAAATGLGAVLAGLHLLAGNVLTIRHGPFGFATRSFPRPLFSELARAHGVRQRALFFALAMATLFDLGPDGKRRLSSTYSVIDDGGGRVRDPYMRMRMRFAAFDTVADFPALVRAVDARLAEAELRDNGFNDAMNAEGIRLHRQLSRLVPFAYTPRLFQFMPYDFVLGLIPPHRLGGGLTAGLLEPVYAGAALEGANACVIVPGRRLVTFNFYIEQKLLPRIARLDAMLADPLTFRSGTAR